MNRERIVFVHGSGAFGAAAWGAQHGLALGYDALFLRRHGFDPEAEPLPTDFAEDARIVMEALAGGGHLVAHAEGAIAAMMTAVEHPSLVHSLVLAEPACLSLTADLPATAAHRALLGPLYARRGELGDEAFHREYSRLVFGGAAAPLDTPMARRAARRLRLQTPPWEAPLQIVPGVPTLVITGGWEPLYEEVASYLSSTGATLAVPGGGHRPQDSAAGDTLIRSFIAGHRHD
jgi:pimeloyl-ACP methyl ester carboxylesterase